MFRKAVIRLTLLYSCLFIVLFWAFSFCLYAYLKNSFKEGYVTRVTERLRSEISSDGSVETREKFFITQSSAVLNKSTEVTLENVRRGLLLINAILFLFIPPLAWVLVIKTLEPVSVILEKQKQFISDASHELRTPLTVAINEIEVSLQQERSLAYYIRTLNTVKEDISGLSELVTNLLLLARHEDNSQPLKMQKVEIVDVLTKILANYSKRFDERKVRYQINFPEENSMVKGNSTMLERAFTNLVDNALKFSAQDSTIIVSIERKGQDVEVIIQDEGIGIETKDQSKIFDRFYRADPSRAQTKGYGLGLAIVKTIIDLHGGSIHLQSSPGKGSIFTVSLPLGS